MPMVKVLTIVRWRGKKGYGSAITTTAVANTAAVHRLRDEQVCNPFDVCDDLASFGKDLWHRRKGTVEQYHARHGSTRLAARPHGDTDVRLLERLHIVDSVADHGDDMALGLEDLDGRQLLFRNDRPSRLVSSSAACRAISSCSFEASQASLGEGRASRLATWVTVSGASPESTLMIIPCSVR